MSVKTYTTHGIKVRYEDNTPRVLEALKQATVRGLEAVGGKAEKYAKDELSKPKVHKNGDVRPNVITGRLRDSISHEVVNKGRGQTVHIGTAVEYAPFVELGTRKSPAYPFLKPAIEKHADEYREILKDSLKNA